MAHIDTLTIQVEANGIAAAKGIDKLTAALGKMNAAVNTGGMARVANETRTLGKAAEKTEKQTSKFGASLIRIAKYRMLRTVLKNITQGLSEGIKNLYAYSEAMNSADAAANKNTMDSYSSSLLYLKNAAGAAAGPLLQALLPVVQQLVDWFVAGANAINQFISALQGKSTFTKAVYNMTEFGEQTQKATGAAKELKKTVMGFDELNLLQVDNGRGGGSADSTPDYSKMFEEAEITDGIKKVAKVLKPLVDYISKNFTSILKVVGAIGAALLTWKIATGVVSFFKTLGEGTITGIKAISTALGTAGLAGVLGVVATEAGLAAYGFGLMYSAYEQGRRIFQNSAAYQNLVTIANNIATNMERARARTNEFQQLVSKWQAEFSKIQYAKNLVDGIYDIYNKSTKTQTEIKKMQDMIRELNGLKLQGLSITYNTATGKILETEDAIRSVIKALEDQAKATALQELLVGAYKLQYGLTSDLEGAESAEADAFRAYMEAVAKYDDYVNSHTGGNLGFWDSIMYGAAGGNESSATFTATDKKAQALAQEVDAAFEVWQAAQKGTNDIATQLDEATNAVERLKNADLYGVLYNASKGANMLHQSMQKLVDMRVENGGASGVSKDIAQNLKSARDYCQTLINNIKNLGNISMKDFVDRLIQAKDMLYSARVNAYNLYDNLNKASKYRLRKMDQYALEHAYVEYDPSFYYASGGFPDEGQLFLAREAGPEMVGTIGGRTAVANNQDIVAAVADGVYNAVMSASSITRNNGGGDVNVVLQLDDYQFGNAVIRSVNSNTRRTGQLQIEGI